ncbi:olfactory receptor 10G7-like [Hyperolius riggenbachi]|uniref:olfactory receptor 10G7-like n=1 Tax=Hyperolius riggenbachi TaxID=752182 RepID=UPI0035A35870
MANQSGLVEFELVGFPGVPQTFHMLLSFAIFIICNITLITNGTVIVLVIIKEKLHQPMYILIGNLAFSDFLFDTTTLPKMMAKYWSNDGKISFIACFFQSYFVHWLGGIDAFILLLMSFDRYVAICQPLRYSSTVTTKHTVIACVSFWIIAAFLTLDTILIFTHPFCGFRVLGFFCNSSTVLRLACGNVNSTRETVLIRGLVVLFGTLAFIVLSYLIILLSVISSSRGGSWRKAFYTCTTHLLVIAIFYVPRVFIYIANYAQLALTPDLNVFLIVLHSYLPPLANPVIYCLRTEDVRKAISSLFNGNVKLKKVT